MTIFRCLLKSDNDFNLFILFLFIYQYNIMNILGKKAPALIESSILNDLIKRNTDIVVPIQKPILSGINLIPDNFTQLCTSFIYKYGIIVILLSILLYYLWNRYNWYKHVKVENELNVEQEKIKNIKKQKQIDHNIKYADHDIPILPRPTPMYHDNPMNEDIRSIYLDRLDPKPVKYIPTEILTGRKSDNYSLDNIYNQPQFNIQNIQPFSGESFYAMA